MHYTFLHVQCKCSSLAVVVLFNYDPQVSCQDKKQIKQILIDCVVLKSISSLLDEDQDLITIVFIM